MSTEGCARTATQQVAERIPADSHRQFERTVAQAQSEQFTEMR